ncbi:hypothetical protein [Nocardia niigatensis]
MKLLRYLQAVLVAPFRLLVELFVGTDQYGGHNKRSAIGEMRRSGPPQGTSWVSELSARECDELVWGTWKYDWDKFTPEQQRAIQARLDMFRMMEKVKAPAELADDSAKARQQLHRLYGVDAEEVDRLIAKGIAKLPEPAKPSFIEAYEKMQEKASREGWAPRRREAEMDALRHEYFD